jgi:hypothetical protein
MLRWRPRLMALRSRPGWERVTDQNRVLPLIGSCLVHHFFSVAQGARRSSGRHCSTQTTFVEDKSVVEAALNGGRTYSMALTQLLGRTW